MTVRSKVPLPSPISSVRPSVGSQAPRPSVSALPSAVPTPPPDPEVEQALLQGQVLFDEGKLSEAHPLFASAHRRRSSDPRCRSWYGLTLILVEHNNNLGVRYCEESVRVSGGDVPAGWLNLARAFRALGYRDRAVKAVQRGLALDEEHDGLRKELEVLGVRRKPVIGFLPRGNFLNRLFGRWRHKISGPTRG